MRSHQAMKSSRADARRRLQAIRTSRIDVRHDAATFDLIEVHKAFHTTTQDEDSE